MSSRASPFDFAQGRLRESRDLATKRRTASDTPDQRSRRMRGRILRPPIDRGTKNDISAAVPEESQVKNSPQTIASSPTAQQ